MRIFILSIFFTGFCLSLTAQTSPAREYSHQASEIEGKHVAYTEIEINASPEVVREKFLEFEKWGEWNSVIPAIAVKTGDINDLSTEPTLELTLDFGRKGDPSPAPLFPAVYDNNEEVFNWGFKKGGLISAEHVFIFEPINDGKGTRFLHYEKMKGMLKSFIMTKKTKANMTEHYNKMNAALKVICEQ